MPQTTILVYRDVDGRSQLREWLTQLRARNSRAHAKCVQRVLQLRMQGHELRRPIAAPLRDGIYELRTQVGTVNYRILYCFIGQNVVVLSHGITKEGTIPSIEIDRAIARMQQASAEPEIHTTVWEADE